MKKILSKGFSILLIVAALAVYVNSQTTEIAYQGQLQSSSAPANGSFDFEFVLFDGGGSQVGPVLQRNNVTVTNGIFSVSLDFLSSFSGATRFLEIRVRQAGGGAFTTLSPRQPVTSSPYAIKSLAADSATNADTATNAVTATNFSGSLAGDVTGPQGSTTVSRIQSRSVASTAPLDGQVLKYNSSTNQWAPGVDNAGTGGSGGTITGVTPGTGLTGGGSTGNVSLSIANGGVATTQIADNAVTSPKIAGGQVVKSIIVGASTLRDNVTLAAGTNISITPAGSTLTIASTGGSVGGSGTVNRIPFWNSSNALSDSLISQSASAVQLPNIVQLASGASGGNVSFGDQNGEAGMTLVRGGIRADLRVDGVNLKLFAGQPANGAPTRGLSINFEGDALIGLGSPSSSARLSVLGGGTNDYAVSASGSLVGIRAAGTNTGVYGIGPFKGVLGDSSVGTGVEGTSTNNVGVLGRGGYVGVAGYTTSGTAISGVCQGTGCLATYAGGTSWFKGNSTPLSTSNTGPGTGIAIGSDGPNGYIFAFDYGAFTAQNLLLNGPGGRVHIGSGLPDQTLSVNGTASKTGGGSWLNYSDVRLKKVSGRFRSGLDVVMRLQPIRYNYTRDNAMGVVSEGEHIGFSAQAVEKLIPEAVTKNDQGYRMVNNDPIMWTMLNAIKEQQAQIEALRKVNSVQQGQISQLKRIVCSGRKRDGACKERR